jgi:S-adenosylmethionine synthetase
LSTSYLWTSEYVSPGHPDKIADQLSDTVLDIYLARDPYAKVACEVLAKGLAVYVAGEITSNAHVPEGLLEAALRTTLREIGYTQEADTCTIHLNISEQSREIHHAVTGSDTTAAGDQGIMFGYATRHTPTGMPPAIYLAKAFIDEAYDRVRRDGASQQSLLPDMKSQVTLAYQDGLPTHIHTIVFSACHSTELSLEQVRTVLQRDVIERVVDQLPDGLRSLYSRETILHLNPAGTWNVGGPTSDAGLTGRKIVVDQYGADCEIGGGAFSGKDPSKVDRSAAYMARHLALVALQAYPEAPSIKVQLSYAIGRTEPISVRVFDPASGATYPLPAPYTIHDLTPEAIITRLGLRAPIYTATARKGHFGVAPYTANGHAHYRWEERG